MSLTGQELPILVYALKHQKYLTEMDKLLDEQMFGTHNGYIILSYEHKFLQKMKELINEKDEFKKDLAMIGNYDVANQVFEQVEKSLDLYFQREFTYCETYHQFINMIKRQIELYDFNDVELQELNDLEEKLKNNKNDYFVLGFDTRHSYDNKEKSSKERVLEDLNTIRNMISL